MKTLRWTIAVLALAALSGCYVLFNYDPGPSVALVSDRTRIVTGEVALLTANAHDPYGNALTYEWYEDGTLIPGQDGKQLKYRTWAEGSWRYVRVEVIVRNDRGGSMSDSIRLTVDPSVSGAVVLINNSSKDVWYFYSRLNDIAWLGDQLDSDILPAGASYVFSDYPTNWYESWDFKAEAFGPTVWQVDNYTFDGPGDVYFMTIID